MTNLIPFLTAALAEDIGTGDVTAMATIPADAQAKFVVRARQEMVVAGLIYLEPLFAELTRRAPSPEKYEGHFSTSPKGEVFVGQGDATSEPLPRARSEFFLRKIQGEGVQTRLYVKDGDRVAEGAVLAELSGPARALLAGERTALNLLQQLSGVATLTRAYVDAVEGTGAQILDTRKTIPGLRHLQKYAVRCGGGVNHRMGLFDAVLIKDNHIAVAGGVRAAVEAALAHAPEGMTIQVECDTLAQVAEAIAAGATMLLLDNMDNDTLKSAVALAKPQGVTTEASGNVNLQTVRGIAETGVDRISIGRLTHSAPAVDIGLDAI
ncbi:MAG: carboxylating nicotinate-nucleotide diphosphorylase [Rickettsiales bacterium]